MFTANRKPLEDYPKLKEYIEKKVSDIQKTKSTIFFEDKRLKTQKLTTLDGQKVEITPFWIPMKETVSIPGVFNGTIAYSAAQPKVEANGLYSLHVPKLRLQEMLALDTIKNAEPILFLREFCSIVKIGQIKEKDQKKEYDEKNAEFTLANEIEYLIRASTSPIAPDENNNYDNMKFIAKAWGVESADNMYVNELRDKLLIKVNEFEKNKENTKRGFKEFREEVLQFQGVVSDDLKMRYDIQKAIETKILKWIPDQFCFILFPGKDIQRQILKVSPNNEPVRVSKLINEFKINRGSYELLLEGIYPKEEDNTIITDGGIDEEKKELIGKINDPKAHHNTLKKLCREAGLSDDTNDKDILRSRLKEKYNC